MSGIVVLENVSKIYSSEGLAVRAVDRVNLKIDKGDFVTLAGPSGSGKSTLLHLIGALDHPSEGKVVVGAVDLSGENKSGRASFRLNKIGFVFQAYNLIPVLSARENVEYPLLLQKIDRKQREDRSMSLLERVGLLDHINKRPGEMSGGQQQRVAVARALATKPEIILADEPTANLDSQTGSALIDLFRELNGQYGVTFIFASHDPRVIGRARHVVRLEDGRVTAEEGA